jgi:hypothetical protein
MKATGKKKGAKRIRLNTVGVPKRQGLKRKNLILDQAKIDRAKEILGVATETEAISRALDAINDLAAFRVELDRGFDDLVGRGGFTDRFGTTSG